jgi:hypothetical protein
MARTAAHEITIGLMRARIFKKSTRAGAQYTVGLTRLFRDGEAWRESNHFYPADIALLRLVLNQAHLWILKQAPSQC